MGEQFYRDHPNGSSRLATESDVQALSRGNGPVGTIGNTVIRLPDQEPVLILGGAGSGKFSQFGAYQLVHPSTQSFFALDVGGQIKSVTWHWNLAERRKAYAINPFRCGAYPDVNHPVDLWGILKDDEFLFDNAKRITEMGIPAEKNEGENSWVGTGARRWGGRFLIFLVLLVGRVTPKSFWQFVNEIDTDDEALKSWGRLAENMPYDVYSTMLEIFNKKHDSPKEYGAIMGKIKDDFDFLSSPPVAEVISGDVDYFADLGDPTKKTGVYLEIPSGSGKFNKSFIRMAVGIAQLHCVRANKGARPLFYLEEAATCGNAEFIKSAASEFRKYFRTVLVYQSHGQLTGLFGKFGAQEIVESCGMQITLGGGIRDVDSAARLARTTGRTTITVQEPAQQDRAFKAAQAAHDGLLGRVDPITAAHISNHERSQSMVGRKVGRDVLDLAEIMRLKNEIIVFAPGSGVPVALAQKLPPYWMNPAMAGRYGPDPLFPPLDSVTLRRRFWGSSKRKFIRKKVPAKLAHWPNHINGEVAYVKGYRTW